MSKSNFVTINFSVHLGDDISDLPEAAAFTFVGNQTSIKSFEIDRDPIDEGYLIVQVYDVQNTGHRILINGTNLPDQDIVRTTARRWQDVMDVIPSGILRRGTNTLQIQRAGGGDNILIGSVVIHWREPEGLFFQVWPFNRIFGNG